MHRCPSSIPAGRWRDLWIDSLKALGEDPPLAKVRLLERMVLNLIEADNALRLAHEQPLVEGSKEQPRENPMFQVAARCDTQARNNARELGLLKQIATDGDDNDTADPFASLDQEDELAARRKKAQAVHG